MLYGTLFMMAGAYALSRNGHVRGDFLYRNFRPAHAGRFDLVLYVLFFFPAIFAFMISGWTLRAHLAQNERSMFSPTGPVIWPFKFLIPVVGVLLLLQGLVEVVRCIRCIRTGRLARSACRMSRSWSSRSSPPRPSATPRSWRARWRGRRPRSRRRARRGDDHATRAAYARPPRALTMTDGALGLLQLFLFLFFIMLGFPIAFTLMAMGLFFGYLGMQERIFDLLVQRTYAVMSNDVLISVPLFVLMGYIIERANILDRLFRSLQMASGNIPGSLAVATLATCALFATATGIVGAVVTLMGLLAFPAMLRAGYDVKLAAGVVCAGGCLGILIPPSIMLILFGATAGVSVVQLYAAAFIPGVMLAGLYILYAIGIAIVKPSSGAAPAAGGSERALRHDPGLAGHVLPAAGGADRRRCWGRS